MNKKKIKLICRSVSYLSQKDEDAFFEWLRKISSIIEIDGWKDELHLYLESDVIPDEDLEEIVAIFYRYEIKDMTQLKIFLNEYNKEWFFDNHHAYWHENIFGEPRVKLICDDAIFNDGLESEEWFEKAVAKIPSVDELDDFGDKLHVYIKSKRITNQDLRSLIALFIRFKIDVKQLEVFVNERNSKRLTEGGKTTKDYWYLN